LFPQRGVGTTSGGFSFLKPLKLLSAHRFADRSDLRRTKNPAQAGFINEQNAAVQSGSAIKS
jgi:hypothetical protein